LIFDLLGGFRVFGQGGDGRRPHRGASLCDDGCVLGDHGGGVEVLFAGSTVEQLDDGAAVLEHSGLLGDEEF